MNIPLEASPVRLPIRALIILVFGLLAAWVAAGSLGWLAPSLEKVLTWLAMAIIVVAALHGRRFIVIGESLTLGAAVLIAVLLTASSLPVVNILAVAILLAAVARIDQGSTGQVAGSTALAVTALAVFRLACDNSAAAWTFANSVGHVEGLCAGWLTGRPLLIGASFGGLDFLVLMTALTAARFIGMSQPRLARAAWAVLFILLAQTAYLVILAFNHDLVALLPPKAVPVHDEFDLSRLGVWTWGNAMHAILPWNLPVVAAVLHAVVAACTFWSRGSEEALAPAGAGRNLQSNWQLFGPAGLLIVAVAAMALSPVKADLKGRRIVAYDDGGTNWTTTDPGAAAGRRKPQYGLLPVLVESLGGEFHRSADLADADLRAVDVLIVLPPRLAADPATGRTPIPTEIGGASGAMFPRVAASSSAAIQRRGWGSKRTF